MAHFKHLVFFAKKGFLSKHYYKELGIDLFLEQGFEVEFWDFSHVLMPWAASYGEEDMPDQVRFEGKRVFKDAEEIKGSIHELDRQTAVINLIRLNAKTKFIYRALTEADIFYMVRYTKAYPHAPSLLRSRNLWDRPIQRWLREAMRTIGLPFLEAYLRWKVKPADLALCESLYARELLGRHLGTSTHILWGHSDSYDMYMKVKEAPGVSGIERDYIVFIDQYIPFHLDTLARKMTPCTTAEEYYPRLVAFFEQVEAVSGHPVVIAAHPKANYEKHPDYFGGRQVIRGKTPLLIRDAKFVLSHASTALNFVVLFQKPVVLITTNALDESPHGVQTRYIGTLLDEPVVNIDEPVALDLDEMISFSKAAYQKYRVNYIKGPGASDASNIQILIEYLQQGEVALPGNEAKAIHM